MSRRQQRLLEAERKRDHEAAERWVEEGMKALRPILDLASHLVFTYDNRCPSNESGLYDRIIDTEVALKRLKAALLLPRHLKRTRKRRG